MTKAAFLFTIEQASLTAVKDLNLDTIFLSHNHINSENLKIIRENIGQTINLFVEVPCFAGSDLLEKYPDAHPIEALGNPTSKEWCVGLCPTHPEVKKERLNRVSELLKYDDINGIWLDFIRYASRWEEPQPLIMDTCYCDRCLKLFSDYLGESITGATTEEKVLLIDGSYYIEWLEFKCLQITSMVKDVRKLIDDSGKKVKLGFFAIPWEDSEHSSAIKRILGQDFEALSKIVDVISPMLYHKMCGKPTDWIKQKVDYFWQFGIPFLPLIQTESRISKVTEEEFKQVLNYAGSMPSSGVCVFFLEDLLKDPAKVARVKEYFSK